MIELDSQLLPPVRIQLSPTVAVMFQALVLIPVLRVRYWHPPHQSLRPLRLQPLFLLYGDVEVKVGASELPLAAAGSLISYRKGSPVLQGARTADPRTTARSYLDDWRKGRVVRCASVGPLGRHPSACAILRRLA